MDVLGICAFDGPSAACLVRSGRVIAAAREDRFTRQPGDPDFPREAIAYCLRAGKLGPADVSVVAFAGGPHADRSAFAAGAKPLPYSDSGGPVTGLRRRLGRWLGKKETVADLVARDLDPSVPVHFVEAERAGVAAAFFASPFDEAAILALGGRHPRRDTGRDAGRRVTLWRGRRDSLERLPDDLLDPTEAVDPDALSPDVAVRLAARARDATNTDALALAGPRAGQRALVAALWRAGIFPELFVHPAAPAGAEAIGAALDFERDHRDDDLAARPPTTGQPRADRQHPGRTRPDRPRASAPGPGYNSHQIRTFLRSQEQDAVEIPRDDAAARVADLLHEGLTVGWFSGRLDLAEDATATRSILSAPPASPPGDPGVETLAVARDDATEVFALEDADAPAFLQASPREAWRDRLGADADPSPRALTILDRDDHSELHAVLAAFRERTGIPVLVARPLARPGEPVACTPNDAYDAYVSLGLDALVMGPYLLRAPRFAPASSSGGSP